MIENFYSDRMSDAISSFYGTREHKEQRDIECAKFKRFEASWTTEQGDLYSDWEEEKNALDCIEAKAAYKTGFLDGIALGIIGATHEDISREEVNDAYRAGREDAEESRCMS
jgi:hypothetical protein